MPLAKSFATNRLGVPRIIFAVILAAASLVGCASGSGEPGIPYVFTPSKNGTFPAVIVLHTSGGVQPHVIDFARDLSGRGYVTAVVDFHAQGGADNIEKGYDFLSKHPVVSAGPIGVVGFSKGAKQAIDFSYYSHNFTKRRVGAIVAYYIGPSLGTNDERHPPILFLHGNLDVHTSPGGIRRYCKLQSELGTHCEAEIFKGVRHAFDHQSLEYDGYDGATTTIAFKRAVSFLNKHLKGASGK